MSKKIHLDLDGSIIQEGDVVCFYFDAVLGTYEDKHEDVNKDDFTEMIDVVKNIDNHLYFISDIGSGTFASRYNEHCKIIGNITDESGKTEKSIGVLLFKRLKELFESEFSQRRDHV